MRASTAVSTMERPLRVTLLITFSSVSSRYTRSKSYRKGGKKGRSLPQPSYYCCCGEVRRDGEGQTCTGLEFPVWLFFEFLSWRRKKWIQSVLWNRVKHRPAELYCNNPANFFFFFQRKKRHTNSMCPQMLQHGKPRLNSQSAGIFVWRICST